MAMTFRKLYWVTEKLDSDGKSKPNGIYTSVVDLIHKGLAEGSGNFRLSLFKLDCAGDPLESWTAGSGADIAEDMSKYVTNGEFRAEEIKELAQAFS